MTMYLFGNLDEVDGQRESLEAGATILRRFALQDDRVLFSAVDGVVAQAPG